MANGFYAQNVLKDTDGVVLGASLADEQVSKDFHITAGGALNLRVDLVADTFTVGAGVSFKLQTSSGIDKDGNVDWIDSSNAVSITAAGSFSLALNVQDTANDEAFLPLRNKGRIVMTTGAGSAVTIERLSLLQAQ